MNEQEMVHSANLDCTPDALFDYLTQPGRWHEWHPNSVGASHDADTLAVGDAFEEEFQIQLLGWAPLRIRRRFSYRVVRSERPGLWEIHGTGRGVNLSFVYRMEDAPGGCRFTRTLRYRLHGPLALLGPLARRRNRQMSQRAMDNLVAHWKKRDS
ncbi:MAG: SRPBCC family protein [Xanthomonadales bacterium]|nr:SRPBCC family protein [Xanthomonadales bacterium]